MAGDCRDSLLELIIEGVQVDSVVMDGPYHLLSVVKRFGKAGSAAAKGGDGRFSRHSAGFMEQTWDGADADGVQICQDVEFWKLVYQVMKPGAYVAAFSSARTGHWQACAMEKAGFIMHPLVGWIFSQGFPKAHSVSKPITDPPTAAAWEGWFYSTQSLKPALEPIYIGQKPYSEKTGYLNVLKHRTGAVNIDGCRVNDGTDNPRWPANIVHDDSHEVVDLFPRGDDGSAARFFNCFPPDAPPILYYPKATKDDRQGSKHPTVKPIALMAHLCRLLTPPGGVVLDPFAGSGTTGSAALREGMRPILMERSEQYLLDIRRRFGLPLSEDPSVLALLG